MVETDVIVDKPRRTIPPKGMPKRTVPPKAQILREAIKYPLMLQREMNNRSLYEFIQYFWPVVSNSKFSENWHIPYLCSELEKVAERVANRKPKEYDLIINVPPGSTKTITCSIMFPVWCWTKWYWMRFICGSYSKDLSLESAEYCRDLVRSSLFEEMYPELSIKEDKDIKSNFKLVKTVPGVGRGRAPKTLVGGSRYSTSVGGTVTGFHGDILLVDDPLNPKQAASDIELANANHWVEQTLSTRKTDKAVTPTILIMQRLHQDDPSGHMLAKEKENVRHISLPGECRNFKEQVKPKELLEKYVDNLLDPKRMPWTVLADMEADLGQYGYSGQVGQNPVPPGGGMFKVDHLSVIQVLPNPNHILSTIRYWDKAATDGAGAYTCGVKMSRLIGNRILIQDVKRGRWSTDQREAIMRSTAEADGPDVEVWLEQEPGSSGKDSAQASVRNLLGFIANYEKPTGNKVHRADPFSVQVNNGSVLLLQSDLWNKQYIEELRYFPFSTYKDQTDASSGAFAKLAAKKIVRVITK